MPQIPQGDNYIDLRKLAGLLISRWPMLLTSLGVFLILAFFYLKITPKLYPVRASIQVIDELVTDKTSGGERFISGQELMAGNPELEDEIGILSSYSLIEQVLDSLDFNISYFRYRADLSFIGKSLAREIYREGLQIVLDTSHLQIINTPIHLSFPDPDHYRVLLNSSHSILYDLSSKKVIQQKVAVFIDETLPLGKPFNHDFLRFALQLDSTFTNNPSHAYYFQIHNKETLVKTYSSRLKINTISKESNIVNLTIAGTLPEKEIDFINALGKEYIENDLQRENQLGLKTIQFIDYQLGLIYDSLETVERSLKSFRQANRIVDIPTSSGNYHAQLEQLEEEQAKLLVQQKYLHYTLENLKENEEIIDVIAPTSVGLNDAFLNNLMLQLSELNKEQISKSYSSGPNNLASQVLVEKIENTKAALKENVNNLLNSTRISLLENKRRTNKILSLIDELPQSERDLININRKFSFNDNVYNYLLEKRVEAGIALASNLPDKRIIDRARQESNEPVSPNKKIILLGAFILGISLPVGFILIQQFLDTRVDDPAEIAQWLQVPVVGSFYRIKKKDAKKLVTFHESGTLKETFRYLIVDLKQDYNILENKVIGVTSFQDGDGKTFCASNLAATFAKSGHRTLLVDSDIHAISQQCYFQSTDHKEGLMEYLTNDKDPNTFIRESPYNNLHYFPSGSYMNGSEKTLLHFENKLIHLFKILTQQYDIIIVDTPSIAKTSDYFLLSRFFSFNLLVVREKKTSKKTIQRMLPYLLRKKLKNLKMVYNDVAVTGG